MKASINRYGQLVVEHGKFQKGYYSVINGIEDHDICIETLALWANEFPYNEIVAIAENKFNFHEAINDYK